MGGPADQNTPTFVVPIGESDRLYTPTDLAGRIENMQTTPEGTLKTVLGPAPWIPDRGQGYPVIGEPHGLFHVSLRGGMTSLLLLRAGGSLFRYAGWDRTWESIATGLTNERRPRYPDQFVAIKNHVIWTNGIDRARLINYDGQVIPLGFEGPPAAPEVDGPADIGRDNADEYVANALGYSWYGGIGDASHLTDAQSGWLLDSTHVYRSQLQDEFGNLGPLSSRSSSASIASMFFSPLPDDSGAIPGTDTSGTNMDDYTRSFQMRQAASTYGHAVAVLFHRSMNTKLHGRGTRFLGRHESQGRCVYPDGKPDALLGAESVEIAAMPVFRVACAHNSSLVIGNFPGDPGLIRESEVDFPGTMPEDRKMRPDSGGGRSHGRGVAQQPVVLVDIAEHACNHRL